MGIEQRQIFGEIEEPVGISNKPAELLCLESYKQALDVAQCYWRALGVWYAIDNKEIPSPVRPEPLLMSSAWLFAYDPYFGSLVTAWFKYRGKDFFDYALLEKEILNFPHPELKTFQLSLAYLYSLSKMLPWHLWELRHWTGWYRVQSLTYKLLLPTLPLNRSDFVAEDRIEEIDHHGKLFKIKSDPHLKKLGLNLPRLGIGEERKILPRAYVQFKLNKASVS